jgi:hypothetical protein
MDMSYLDLLMAQQEEVTEAEGGGGVWVVADLANGTVAPVRSKSAPSSFSTAAASTRAMTASSAPLNSSPVK